MCLEGEMVRQGAWLFRWRSYLPLPLMALLFFEMRNSTLPLDAEAFSRFWEVFCGGLATAGLIIRAVTAGSVPQGTSGRNTLRQIAHSLNTTGTYSVVRHPLYFANFLIGLGGFLLPGSPWLALVYMLAFWIYYERIMLTEEHFLSGEFGEHYTTWSRKTPCFVPRFQNWLPFDGQYSWRAMIRKEYTTWLIVAFGFLLLDVIASNTLSGGRQLDPARLTIVVVAAVNYAVVWLLKHKTSTLTVLTPPGPSTNNRISDR